MYARLIEDFKDKLSFNRTSEETNYIRSVRCDCYRFVQNIHSPQSLAAQLELSISCLAYRDLSLSLSCYQNVLSVRGFYSKKGSIQPISPSDGIHL